MVALSSSRTGGMEFCDVELGWATTSKAMTLLVWV